MRKVVFQTLHTLSIELFCPYSSNNYRNKYYYSQSVKHKSHPIDLHITYFKVKDILETCRSRIVVAPEWIDWIFRSRN